MKIGIRVAYIGTKYCGFQKQKRNDDKLYAIQDIIENILEKVHRRYISTIGSSRTDAGVHSNGNYVVFETDKDIKANKWKDVINANLPDDIIVIESEEVDKEFHPLKEKSKKCYMYRFSTNKYLLPKKRIDTWIIGRELDIKKINEAAQLIKGTHDFRAFKSGKKKYNTTIREIYKSEIIIDDDIITYKIEGNGFMYNMVRIIVGTLVEIGLGKRKIDDIYSAYKTGDSKFTGATAPANGLTLEYIKFGR